MVWYWYIDIKDKAYSFEDTARNNTGINRLLLMHMKQRY